MSKNFTRAASSSHYVGRKSHDAGHKFLGLKRRFSWFFLALLAGFCLALNSPAAHASVSVTVSGGGAVCAGTPVTFSATYTTSGCEGTPGNATYQWYVGSLSNPVPAPQGTSSSYNYTPSSSTTLYCQVSVGSCGAANGSTSVSITPFSFSGGTPSPSTSSPSTCDTVQFTDNAQETCGSGSLSYSWNFGDGSPAGAGSSPQHRYTSTGTKTVTVSITDGGGRQFGPYSTSVTVSQGPAESLNVSTPTASPASATTCQAVTFRASASETCGNYNLSYKWNFDDPSGSTSATSTATSPSYTFTTIGNHSVTVTVTDTAGRVKTSSPVTVTVAAPTISLPPPTATPSSPTACDQVQFSASPAENCDSSAWKYAWTFGDTSSSSNTSTLASPTHQYAAAGTYPISLQVTDGAGRTQTNQSLTLTVAPPVIPAAPTNLFTTPGCAGETIVIWTAASGASSYNIYRSSGGGAFTKVSSVTGTSFSDFNTASGTSYCYQVTGANKCGTEGPASASVCDSGGSSSSSSVTVTVSPHSSTMCAGGSQYFAATYTGASCESTGSATYAWYIDGAVSSYTGSACPVSFSQTGSHTVSCKVTTPCGVCGSGSGGTATVTVSTPGVTINSASGAPTAATTCDPVQFSASATDSCSVAPLTYSWDFGDKTGSSTWNPSHTYAAPPPTGTSYTVTLTVSDGLSTPATKTFQQQVSQGNIPGADTNVTATAVSATEIDLSWTAAAGGTTHTIYRSTSGGSFSKVGTATGTTYKDTTVSGSTSYCYEVTAKNGCGEGPRSSPDACATSPCAGTVTISTATASPKTVCVNQNVTFTAAATNTCGGPLTYSWDFGDGSPAKAGSTVIYAYPNANPKVDSKGNPLPYTATVTVSGGTNTPTKTVQVTVQGGQPRTSDPGNPHEPEYCSNDTQADGYSGAASSSVNDPVATRGYPLAWSIEVNSQAVDMNRPLANAAFTYDMHVGTQAVYNGTCNSTSDWLVVGGNGRRLDFGPASGTPAPTGGVFSSLTVQQTGGAVTGYTVSGAGDPTDMASAGDFTYSFDATGRLTQITDPAGNAQVVSYTGSQLTQVQDVNTGKTLSFTWSGNQITLIKDNPSGTGAALAQTALAYTGNELTSVQAQDGTAATMTSWQYGYYSDGTLKTSTRDNDSATTVTVAYTPHASTNCTTPVLMANLSTSQGGTQVQWGGLPQGTAADTVYNTNVNGGQTRYDYDTFGNLIHTVEPTPAGATAGPTETTTYDTGGQREVLTDTDGLLSEQFSYTGNGLLKTQSETYNGATQIWTNTYNGADLVSSQDPVQQAAGVFDTYAYADTSQPHVATSHTDADGDIWYFAHNTHGQITKVTPPAGSQVSPSTITYDEAAGSPTLGYLLSATDGAGDLATNDAYDALGDLLSVSTYPVAGSTATQETTLLAYDGLQRVTKVTHPDSHTFQSVYNGRNLASTTDEAGTQFFYNFCACGAMTGTSGPLGWSLGWAYDTDHELTAFTDANGHQTLYTNGQDDELDQVIYPDNSILSYGYNNYGLQSAITNARGDGTQLGYDGAERLTSEAFPTTNQAALGFSYNPDDTPARFTDGVGATAYTYDLAGRVTKVVYNYAASGLANAQELDYAYYPDGLRQTLTWKNGAATVGQWNYSYDAAGRLARLTNLFNELTQWSYDGEGKLVEQINNNGTNVTYGYNNQRGWPTSITDANGVTTFASYGLTYDQGSNTVGNLTGVTEWDGSTALFGYDALSRLTAEQRTGTAAESHSYGYDPAGNMTSKDGSTTNLSYDAANKLSTTSVFSYDKDGDMTSSSPSGSSYGWDDRGNMVSRTVSGQVSYAYGYNAMGLRVHSVITPGGQPTVNTFFVYDGDTLLGEVSSTGTVNAVYTWGADGLASERLAPTGTTPKSLWYAFGPQGETRQLTNSTGQVVDSYAYTAWGQALSSTGSDANPFQYGGKYGYYSEYGGSVLCGHRWYDTAALRWLSRDPIGYKGGDNLYAYCGDDPVNKVDPHGLQALDDPASQYWNALGNNLQKKFDNVQNVARGWNDALGALGDYLLGTGPNRRVYGPNSTQAQQMCDSRAGDQIRNKLRKGANNGFMTTPGAALNTFAQFGNGTQAQVGGFFWDSQPSSNGYILVHVENTISTDSLFYHYFYLPIPQYNYERAARGFGPLGNIHQDYYWYEQPPIVRH